MFGPGIESRGTTVRGGVRSEYLKLRKAGLNEGEGGGLAGLKTCEAVKFSGKRPVTHAMAKNKKDRPKKDRPKLQGGLTVAGL